MVFLYFLEEVFIALGALFLIFQVLVPLLSGKPLWPSFRSKAKANETLIETKEDIAEAIIEQKIQQAERIAEKIRNKTQGEKDGNVEPKA